MLPGQLEGNKAIKEMADIEHLKSAFGLNTEKMLELQRRSLREHLVFRGWKKNVMKFDCDIRLVSVHRMGRPRTSFPRRIVATFERYKDREEVRKAAPRAVVGRTSLKR